MSETRRSRAGGQGGRPPWDNTELTATERFKLVETYRHLQELATCGAPAVRSAARNAVAEVHAALDGQGIDFDYYSHRWLPEPT